MATIPLFLSDIAGSEILLILVFILVFFGSKSIPGIARTMGRTIRQIKDASQEMQNEIIKSGGDLKGDFDLQRIVNDTKSDIAKPFLEHARTLDQAVQFDAPKSFVRPEDVQVNNESDTALESEVDSKPNTEESNSKLPAEN